MDKDPYEKIKCPIIRCCIKRIRFCVFLEEDDIFEIVHQKAVSASDDHGLICLRGFIAVELMLSLLSKSYFKRHGVSGPQLTNKSWSGLTLLKDEIEDIIDRCNLEHTEERLGGKVINISGVWIGRGDNSVVERSMLNSRISEMAKSIDNSITVLRPYLRNSSSSVVGIADDLMDCHISSHGFLDRSRASRDVLTLIEVRL